MNILTNEEFTYRETPVDYDGIAQIDSLKGNTLVWNQLCSNGNFADSSGWNTTNSTLTISSNTGKITASARYGNISHVSITGIPSGHKLLGIITAKSYTNTETQFLLRTVNNGSVDVIGRSVLTTTDQTHYITITTGENAYVQFIIQDNNASGWGEISFRNANLFDLTKMFGSGNEPTVDEFVSLFTSAYYTYDTGSLLDFTGTKIKTVCKNLNSLKGVDKDNEYGLKMTVNDDASVHIKGTATHLVDYPLGATNTTYIGLPNGSYKFSGITGGSATTYKLYATIKSNITGAIRYVGIETGDGSFTLDNEVVRLFVRIYDTAEVDFMVYPMIRFASAESGFVPYEYNETDLPISTFFPTGMKSAGSAYDELTPTKAITRIGFVDLGSLTWAYDTSDAGHERLYTTSTLSNCRTYTNAQVANAVCGKYEVDTNNNTYAHTQDKSFSINSVGRLYVYDSAYTDAAVFKTAMDGVMLNYELATPTEVDAEPIKYNFYANGTEQIIPSSSAPIAGAFTYYDMTEGDTPYRKFWLINAKGERWNLTERESRTFLNEPDGLGYTKSITAIQYGRKQNITNVDYEFPQPQGDVIFFDHANSTRYEKYHQFVKFLSYYPLTLYYHLPLSYYSRIPNIYTLDVVVESLGKTESKPDNLMTCPIVFNALSFYRGDEVTISGSGTSYTITNDGDFPVGFEITVIGSLTNPYIELYQNNELYGKAGFEDNTAFSSVYINSNDGEQDVKLKQGNSDVANPLAYQDLSIANGSIYVTFVKLARGETSLEIGMDSGSLTSVNIKFKPIFRSV